ncbi:MAG: hypothetical protein ACJAYE_000504 [Candidatus Azotimanducaceae bacterium]|jgi:hypothetical protein
MSQFLRSELPAVSALQQAIREDHHRSPTAHSADTNAAGGNAILLDAAVRDEGLEPLDGPSLK